ncbi:MAG: hypothetical protein Q4B15_05590 [Lachnospiraceae bacterium]|nr:hypothetical protein [Lachnospiraceae bacterium]
MAKKKHKKETTETDDPRNHHLSCFWNHHLLTNKTYRVMRIQRAVLATVFCEKNNILAMKKQLCGELF